MGRRGAADLERRRRHELRDAADEPPPAFLRPRQGPRRRGHRPDCKGRRVNDDVDGTERTFDAETVLVCDRNGPTGIAGIMGGQVSEVEDSTTRVLLEAANWNGTNTLRTSSMLGLRSEASARFEKGLHPEIAMRGQIVGSKLLVELGAELVPGTIDESAELPAPHVIPWTGTRAEALLGVAVDRSSASESLGRLGFDVAPAGEGDLYGHDARSPSLRRHPRGRRNRGGRPARGLRPAAEDAAHPRRARRRAEPRPAAAPPRGGRPPRRRLRRGRHLVVRRARPGGEVADR